MAHANNNDKIKDIVHSIRNESEKLGQNIGIIMDLAGPKIRVDLSNIGNESIHIKKNHVYTLGYSKINDIPINLDLKFKNTIDSKSFVKIDDGRISFKVISIRNNVMKIKANDTGQIYSKKGVNFPGVELKIPSITEKDVKDIKLGIKLGIDWFALSFVRNHKDYDEIVKIFNSKLNKIPIMAKIEKPEAIDDLDNIINSFDGILVARGDLGVEMDLEKLPILQKKIIDKCQFYKKPVIVATQMLESMTKNSAPTRAEVNDVANAVYDNADAVMLSGETAVGDYPIEAISIMNKIIINIENEIIGFNSVKINEDKNDDYRSAIGNAIKSITKNLNIDAIVVMTESGSTARIISNYNINQHLFALSPHQNICNQMSLYKGVVPIKASEYLSTDEMLMNAERILLENNYIRKGQTFIMTAGVPVGVTGSTNMLKIQKIEKD